jgi:hypothetical protein
MIAATALASDRIVVTADAAGFDGLPDVRVRAGRPDGAESATTIEGGSGRKV